ncbi:MAG: amidohydrolase [Lachnospiraceae bacterium]|nr:amidohydrolase [Lachnospiraceae bacterium]
MYKDYLSVIDKKKQEIFRVSDEIWNHAETSFREYQSSGILAEALNAEGFVVETCLADIPTAFKATFGTGHPAIGILAEFDALDGLNQEAGEVNPKKIPGPDVGHGCGHNLFAGGSFAAALALKEYILKTGKGSVTLFGCPAEENGGGKVFLSRAGVFSGIDSIVSWHPEKMYMVRTRRSLANVMVVYHFDGIAAHAGGSPQKGRSALDAVELMNVGCNYLREHMDTTSRIHYAVIDSGGTAPNVVQAHAEVKYMIRAIDNDAVRALKARVDKVAQGAAMMTETSVSSRITAAYSNLITIPTLQETAYSAMKDTEFPMASEKELEFGEALRKTMNLSEADLSGPVYAERLLSPAPPKDHGGSTDTADVSWNCPTVQMHIGTWCIGTPGHSWQAVSQGKSTYAKKAMLYAGKSVAGTAIRLMEDPNLIKMAWKELREQTGRGYVCPLPEELRPEIPRE